jgi:hypothetical protein
VSQDIRVGDGHRSGPIDASALTRLLHTQKGTANMAQQTTVALIDDIDGGKAAETVSFGLDGSIYEIDLSKKNATALRKALGEFPGSMPGPCGNGRRSRVLPCRLAAGCLPTWWRSTRPPSAERCSPDQGDKEDLAASLSPCLIASATSWNIYPVSGVVKGTGQSRLCPRRRGDLLEKGSGKPTPKRMRIDVAITPAATRALRQENAAAGDRCAIVRTVPLIFGRSIGLAMAWPPGGATAPRSSDPTKDGAANQHSGEH